MSFDGIWPLTTGYCNTQSVEIGDAVNIEFDLHSLTWNTGESTVFIHFFDIGDDADALAFSMRYSGPLKALYFKYMKADGSHTSIQALGRTFESPADDDVTVHHEIIVTQSHFIWKMDGIAVVDTDKVPHATGTYGAYFPFLTNGASRASTDTAIMSDFAVYEPLSAHKGTEKRDAFYPNNKNIPSVFEPKPSYNSLFSFIFVSVVVLLLVLLLVLLVANVWCMAKQNRKVVQFYDSGFVST
eukprot:828310_1